MTKQTINLWGRELELNIIYDCYPGEEVLDTQKKALERILENHDVLEKAKANVQAYCVARDSEKIAPLPIENIFKYVVPNALYIQRTKDDKRIVGLMCDYRFNPEDGLSVIFCNEQLIDVGTQNLIL